MNSMKLAALAFLSFLLCVAPASGEEPAAEVVETCSSASYDVKSYDTPTAEPQVWCRPANVLWIMAVGCGAGGSGGGPQKFQRGSFGGFGGEGAERKFVLLGPLAQDACKVLIAPATAPGVGHGASTVLSCGDKAATFYGGASAAVGRIAGAAQFAHGQAIDGPSSTYAAGGRHHQSPSTWQSGGGGGASLGVGGNGGELGPSNSIGQLTGKDGGICAGGGGAGAMAPGRVEAPGGSGGHGHLVVIPVVPWAMPQDPAPKTTPTNVPN